MDSVVNYISSHTTGSSHDVLASPPVKVVLLAQIIAFVVAKVFNVARSLFVRVCDRDGEGINFNLSLTSYVPLPDPSAPML